VAQTSVGAVVGEQKVSVNSVSSLLLRRFGIYSHTILTVQLPYNRIPMDQSRLRIQIFFCFTAARQPLFGQGILIIAASRSHSDTSHSVGLLWTSDQPEAQTST